MENRKEFEYRQKSVYMEVIDGNPWKNITTWEEYKQRNTHYTEGPFYSRFYGGWAPSGHVNIYIHYFPALLPGRFWLERRELTKEGKDSGITWRDIFLTSAQTINDDLGYLARCGNNGTIKTAMEKFDYQGKNRVFYKYQKPQRDDPNFYLEQFETDANGNTVKKRRALPHAHENAPLRYTLHNIESTSPNWETATQKEFSNYWTIYPTWGVKYGYDHYFYY